MPDVVAAAGLSSEPVNGALKWTGWIFFIFTLFPAIIFIPLPIETDTQPNALVVASIIFLLGRNVRLPFWVWSLLILFICAITVFLSEGVDLNVARSLVGYGTVFFMPVAVLVLATGGVRMPDRLLDMAVYIWGFVGAVQLFVWPSFMTFMVTASRTTETRGVASLSNEPSLYATTLIFFIILYFIRKRERCWPVFLCLLQIVLFAQSALGILFALMMLGLYTLHRFSAPTAIAVLLVFTGALLGIAFNSDELLAGTRVGGLIHLAMNSPAHILQLDESVNSRVANIFYSLKGAVDAFFIPHGFNVWETYSRTQDQIYSGIMRSGNISRIMSGYGTALFEMGIAGVAIPIVITIGILRTMWRADRGRAILMLFVVHLLLITPVPLAFPLLGYLIGELFITSLPSQASAAKSSRSLYLPITGMTNRVQPIADL